MYGSACTRAPVREGYAKSEVILTMVDSIGPRQIVSIPAKKPLSRDDPKKPPKENRPAGDRAGARPEADGRRGTLIDDRS